MTTTMTITLLIITAASIALNVFQFMERRIEKKEVNGHQFELVKVENSTDYLIIRDGRQTRRVKQEIAEKAIENVDKLFKD